MFMKQRLQLKEHHDQFEKVFYKRHEYFQSKLLATVQENMNLDMLPQTMDPEWNHGSDSGTLCPVALGTGERVSGLEREEFRRDVRGTIPAGLTNKSLSSNSVSHDSQSQTVTIESEKLESAGSIIKGRVGDSLREPRKPSCSFSAADSSGHSDIIRCSGFYGDEVDAMWRCQSPDSSQTLSSAHSIVKRTEGPGSGMSGAPSISSSVTEDPQTRKSRIVEEYARLVSRLDAPAREGSLNALEQARARSVEFAAERFQAVSAARFLRLDSLKSLVNARAFQVVSFLFV